MSLFKLSPDGFVVEYGGPPLYPGEANWVRLNGNGAWTEEGDGFIAEQVADWPDLIARPVRPVFHRMPPCVPPERWKTETEPAHAARVYRWRVWLLREPRPDLWFADPDDVKAYQAWRDTDPVGRVAHT